MNKGYVYVLKCSDGRHYTGSTRDIEKRLKDHNAGRVRTTKNRRPVKLIYMEEFSSYSDARTREMYLKSGTGRTWLGNHAEGWPSG